MRGHACTKPAERIAGEFGGFFALLRPEVRELRTAAIARIAVSAAGAAATDPRGLGDPEPVSLWRAPSYGEPVEGARMKSSVLLVVITASISLSPSQSAAQEVILYRSAR
jgi:hypothetical protein